MITNTIQHMVDFITGLHIPDLHVTANAIEATNHLNHNRAVAYVNPPAIEPAAGGVYEMEFSVIVAAGPYDKPDRATDALDPIVTELMTGSLMPERATPQTFESFDGRHYPCYVLTCTTDTD